MLSTVYDMFSTAFHKLSTSYQSPPWTPLWVLATTSQPLLDTETLRRYCSTATADIQTINRAGSILNAAQFGLNSWVLESTEFSNRVSVSLR